MAGEVALGLSGLGADPRDDALVEAAVQSPDALGELYSRYLPRVYRYLSTRTDSADEAGDLTQQVFLRAFAGLSKYRPQRKPFSAWLFRIAHSVAVDSRRRRRTTGRGTR